MVDKFVVDEKRIRNHFVVEIPVTPKWKIEAIAKYIINDFIFTINFTIVLQI